jgi:signal transduction histidine kinase
VEIKVARALDRMIVTVTDITNRKLTEEALTLSQQELRELATRLQQAREDERTFIAREIHDELGQLLTGLKFDIKWLEKRLPTDSKETEVLKKKTASILELVDESIRALRRIASDFRPGLLDTLGLIAAIEGHAEEFRQRTGIQCKFTERKIPGLADRNRETAIFRICQEALTNVARHSNATEVSIRLNQQNGSVVLQVQDNGKGITAKEVSDSRSLGLLGMRERALLFGGEISFYGAPGKGTRVTATIPLNHTEKA